MPQFRTYWTKSGTITKYVEELEDSYRAFDDETRAIQLEHLAKIISMSTVEYPSDRLVTGYSIDQSVDV